MMVTSRVVGRDDGGFVSSRKRLCIRLQVFMTLLQTLSYMIMRKELGELWLYGEAWQGGQQVLQGPDGDGTAWPSGKTINNIEVRLRPMINTWSSLHCQRTSVP